VSLNVLLYLRRTQAKWQEERKKWGITRREKKKGKGRGEEKGRREVVGLYIFSRIQLRSKKGRKGREARGGGRGEGEGDQPAM